MKPKLSSLVLGTIATLFVVLIGAVVASSLTRPEVETFVPTPPSPEEVGERSIGPRQVTVDARSHEGWTYFDFSRGAAVAVDSRSSTDWDIAFQRHRMLTNGGATNPLGAAAVIDLGPIALDVRIELPENGYTADERRGDDARNRVLEDWYEYSWTSHILSPADRTFGLRTADGKYALLRFRGYYCPGGRPGCITFSYRYRGDGGREFE